MLDKNLTTDKKGERKDVDQETVDLSLSSKLDKKLQEAIELHQKNQLIRAKKVCGQILSINSQHTSTIHLLGLIAFQENQPQKAAKLVQHAIKLDDTRPAFYRSLGSILQHLGQLQESINAYQCVLSIAPNDHKTWNDIGHLFRLLGKMDQAYTYFQNSITILPNYSAFYNLGLLLQERGQLEESIAHYKESIAINPNLFQAYSNLGNVFQEIGQYNEAYSYYQKAIQINPKYFEVEMNLGILCMKMETPDEATKHFQRVLQLNPKHPEAYNNLGLTFQQQGEVEKAKFCFRRALEINAVFSDAYTNLGNILLKEDEGINKAITLYNRAINVDPNNYEAFYNLSYAQHYQGSFEQALQSCRHALLIDPNQAKAHINYSMTLLTMGRFSEGWKESEWRWKDVAFESEHKRNFPQPLWDGSSLTGKTILIWLEQGVGDQIMFASLLPKLQQQARQVIVETGKRLIPIFQRSYPDIDIVPAQNPPDSLLLGNSIDFQSPIASLPQWCLPDEVSFPRYQIYLEDCSQKTTMLRRKYQKLAGGKILIGISWKSTHNSAGKLKSTSLTNWESLLSQTGCFFVNLQYGDVKQELEEFTQQTGIEIYCDEEINSLESLDDFASQIAALDLIISTSNTTVHVAGALGKPVWTLLNYVPSWRWMIDRSDSLWYPSMVLFRQGCIGDWSSVFQSVHHCLKNFLQSLSKFNEDCPSGN